MTSLFQQEKTTPWQKQGREDKCVSDDWRDAEGDNCVCPALPAIAMLGNHEVFVRDDDCTTHFSLLVFVPPSTHSPAPPVKPSPDTSLHNGIWRSVTVSRVAWQCCRLHYNIPHTVGRLVIVGFGNGEVTRGLVRAATVFSEKKQVEYCFPIMRERK